MGSGGVSGTGGRGDTTGSGGTAGSGGQGGTAGTTSTGGTTGSGGVAGTGGAAGSAGSTGMTCALPTKFKWTSTGPVATPKAPAGKTWVALKDFTNVVFNGVHIVYMSTHDSGTSYGSSDVHVHGLDHRGRGDSVRHASRRRADALLLRPEEHLGARLPVGLDRLQLRDLVRSHQRQLLVVGEVALRRQHRLRRRAPGPIDQTVICNSTDCYLFFAGDNGSIYRSSMAIGSFPGTFGAQTTVMTDTTANLFEAVEVYAVKGANQYLMIVEAEGANGRYFRSFTATDLGGSWTALAATESNPFAGKANVTFTGTAWTNDISHGDMVRNNADETMTVDPCNMQFLFQGRDPSSNGTSYDLLPYRPGLLTLQP